MTKIAKEIHAQLKKDIASFGASSTKHTVSYHGTTHRFYGLTSAQKAELVKAVKKKFDLSLSDFVELVDLLYHGDSYEEKTLAGDFLFYFPHMREEISLSQLDTWLGQLEGWAEVDTTCQSMFTAEELLGNWQEWQVFLRKLNKDQNIHKRRASMVLLIKAIRESDDARLSVQALENIDSLVTEEDILITKATSWLLREMIKKHRSAVVQYMQTHQDVLPKIAVRETKRKLETGRK